MQGTRSRRLVLLALVLILALGALPSIGQANHRFPGGLHWARKENPFTLEFGNNGLGNNWGPGLDRSVREWSRARTLEAKAVRGRAGNPLQCNLTQGRVEVCAADYGETGWVGITRFRTRGKHITAATIRLNDYYQSNPSKFPEISTAEARRTTVCHEMGHTLGLAHGIGGHFQHSCMYQNTDINIDHPSSHDINEVDDIYRHTDGFTSVDNGRLVGTAGAVAEPPVPSGGPKQQETFVHDVGDGTQIVTIVDWYEPAA